MGYLPQKVSVSNNNSSETSATPKADDKYGTSSPADQSTHMNIELLGARTPRKDLQGKVTLP